MQNLILLHGALGSAEQLGPIDHLFSKDYVVHRIDFSGHGKNAAAPEMFTIELFASDVLQYMLKNGLENATIFGYSMGGYVGMWLAKNNPDKVKNLITLATKFHWDETVAAKEVKMLDPDQITIKVPAFAETLKQRHSSHDWKLLMNKTADMMVQLGKNNPLKPEDYPSVNTPCLLLLGDRDKMITLDETVQAYRLLPNAQMGILPNTGHPIEKLNLNMLKTMLDIFCKND